LALRYYRFGLWVDIVISTRCGVPIVSSGRFIGRHAVLRGTVLTRAVHNKTRTRI